MDLFILWGASLAIAGLLAFIGQKTNNKVLYYIFIPWVWINVVVIKVVFWLIGCILTGILGGLVYHRLTFGPIFSLPPSHPPYQSGPAPSIDDEN